MALTTNSINRLTEAMEASYKDLEPFRKHSYHSIQQYCGRHYGRNQESIKRTPVNFLQFAIEIYVQKLAANAPNFLVNTEYPSLKETAGRCRLAMNHLAKEIKLKETLSGALLNAMFNIGIVKVGTASVDRGMIEDATQPYVELIDLDDFVFDTNATRREYCQFMGHRFRMDREVFENCGLYENTDKVGNMETRSGVFANEYTPTDMVNDRIGWETYRDQVELWEMFLPFENVILTMPTDGSGMVCRVQPHQGGELGPYRFLTLHDVPKNIMPLPPTALWLDLHEMGNGLFRKIQDQSERQKTITGYRNGAAKDAERIRDANDGEMVAMQDPDSVREYSFGGASGETQAAFLMTKDLYSYFGGNIDLLGGLGAHSDTASQDAMLSSSAGSRIESLHQKFLSFCQGVGESLLDELWNDPLLEMPLVKQVPGFGIRIPTALSADTLEGDFLDYNIEVEPYSTMHRSPEQRLGTIGNLLERFIYPALPFFQQQGGQIDMQALVDLLSKYSGMPEFGNIITFGEFESEKEPVHTPGPSKTTREYVRRNVPTGGTREFRDNQLSQALLGQNSQPRERGALMRPGA